MTECACWFLDSKVITRNLSVQIDYNCIKPHTFYQTVLYNITVCHLFVSLSLHAAGFVENQIKTRFQFLRKTCVVFLQSILLVLWMVILMLTDMKGSLLTFTLAPLIPYDYLFCGVCVVLLLCVCICVSEGVCGCFLVIRILMNTTVVCQ